jgi:CBS domain-containing protein
MLVKDVMTPVVQTCMPASSVGEAAEALRACCGCLPVVDGHGRMVGIVTDRDVCLVVARRRDPWGVPVADVLSPQVIACHAADHVDVALVAMKENGVQRVPVVDGHGRLKGIVSIDDLIRHTGTGKGTLPAEAVLDVLRHVCESKMSPTAIDTTYGTDDHSLADGVP